MNRIIETIQRNSYATTFVVAFLLFYGLDLWQWLHQLPASSEDGLKNFFTLAYHVGHDPNPFWFEGMNYPQGEHLIYTDNQPLIAIFLWFVDILLPIEEWLPWLMPLMLIASFYLGGLLLFRMIKPEGQQDWVAAILATSIVLLSPQWQRLTGHYSLAHGVVIPAVIYSLWRYWEYGRGLRWVVLACFLSGFIHPYFIAMNTGLLVVFLYCHNWKQGALNNLWGAIKPFLLGIAPLLLFRILLWLTDGVLDRPTQPYGFLEYSATWRSVFFPMEETLPTMVNDALGWAGDISREGSFYIGLVAIIGAFVLLGQAIRLKRNMRFEHILLLASIPMLLLSLALPFSISKLYHLLDYTGPLKQFRGIARFAWVFYYAVNLGTAIVLIRNWDRAGRRWLILFSMAIMLGEAWLYRGVVSDMTSRGSDRFHTASLPEDALQQYDAILPLPYFHVGSENLRTPEAPGMLLNAFDLSMETGLPLLSVQMSRTSLGQSIEHLSLTRHVMSVPNISIEQADDQWLILMDEKAELPPYQRQLIGHATRVGSFEGYGLYSLRAYVYIDILEANIIAAKYLQAQGEAIEASKVDYHEAGYFFDDLDPEGAQGPQPGKCIQRIDWTSLMGERLSLGTTDKHELTFWMKADDHGAMNSQLWYWERKGDEDVEFHVTEVGDHAIGFLKGWALCKIDLQAHEAENTFQLMIHRDGENLDLWIDDVMLRPLDRHLFRPEFDQNINNRYYELPDASGVEEGY